MHQVDHLLSRLDLCPADHSAAVRRADAIAAHLSPAGAVGAPGALAQMPHAALPRPPHASAPLQWRPPARASMDGISAHTVQRLDDAHAAAWQSLASPSREEDISATGSELEAAYRATLGEALGVGDRHAGRQAGSSEQDGFAESSVEAMERVWKQLSLADGQAQAGSGGGAATNVDPTDLDAIWQRLQGGDYDSAWDGVWDGSLGLGGDALSADVDVDAPYRFQESNPHLGGLDLLARGTELFERGELREAILVLEAAVQAQPEDTMAWQTLGQAHADADDDAQAIACLRRAVKADPHNLDALLALGVSYTNELDQSRALHHLQHWLESHPDFASLGLAVEPAAKANPFRLQQQAPRQHGHRMGTAWGHRMGTMALHCMCTACALHVHCMRAACALHVRCIHAAGHRQLCTRCHARACQCRPARGARCAVQPLERLPCGGGGLRGGAAAATDRLLAVE